MSQKWFNEEGMDLYKERVWIKVTTMDEPIKPFPLGWTKFILRFTGKERLSPTKTRKKGRWGERERQREREKKKSCIPKTNLLSPSFHLAMHIFPGIPVPSYPTYASRTPCLRLDTFCLTDGWWMHVYSFKAGTAAGEPLTAGAKLKADWVSCEEQLSTSAVAGGLWEK